LRNSAEYFFDRALGVIGNDEDEQTFPAKVDTLWFQVAAHGGMLQLELRQCFGGQLTGHELFTLVLFLLKQRVRRGQNSLVLVIPQVGEPASDSSK